MRRFFSADSTAEVLSAAVEFLLPEEMVVVQPEIKTQNPKQPAVRAERIFDVFS